MTPDDEKKINSCIIISFLTCMKNESFLLLLNDAVNILIFNFKSAHAKVTGLIKRIIIAATPAFD